MLITSYFIKNLIVLLSIFFISPSICTSRLKITTITALDTPIPQITGIITKLIINGRSNWEPSLLSSKEWCLYLRFLYDNILRRKRYSYDNRYVQINDFFNAKKDIFVNGMLNFGVVILDGIQVSSNNPIIYEPLFQKFVYPFIQNPEEQEKIELQKNILEMLQPNFKMNEFSTDSSLIRTECGPCLDMYEMIHFLFLLGYSNVGLKYFRDNQNPPGQRTENTTYLVSSLINTLSTDENSQNSFLRSMNLFTYVLKNAFGMQDNELYLDLSIFSGSNDEEKYLSRGRAMSQMLIYYTKMQEHFVLVSALEGNPDLEQFFIKGGVMLCTYGIKQYLLGDLVLNISDNDAVNEVASLVVTQVAGETVSSTINAIDIPNLVASENQKVHGSSEANIFENLFSAFGAQFLPEFYIKIDQEFLSFISNDENCISVNFDNDKKDFLILI